MNKYPGYRHMTGAERYNARMERIWEDARRREAERLARGEIPNPNLTPVPNNPLQLESK